MIIWDGLSYARPMAPPSAQCEFRPFHSYHYSTAHGARVVECLRLSKHSARSMTGGLADGFCPVSSIQVYTVDLAPVANAELHRVGLTAPTQYTVTLTSSFIPQASTAHEELTARGRHRA